MNNSAITYLGLTLILAYAFTYTQWQELQILINEQSKYQDTIEKIEQIETRKNELLTQFNKISAEDRAKIETLLPDRERYVRLASNISSVAAKHGITIDNVSSKIKNNPTEIITEGGSDSVYGSSIISLGFKGNYDSFNKMMIDLEKSLRVLDIRSIKLSKEDNVLHKFEIELETYWYRQ